MEFRFHDIFSKMIPGGFLSATVVILLLPTIVENIDAQDYLDLLKDFEGLVTSMAIILVYFIGYLIDAMSSIWTEKLLWRIWGGWPIILLHKHKYTDRTTFPESDDIFKAFSIKIWGIPKETFTEEEYDRLYYYAQSIFRKSGNDKQQERQNQYIESYIFSRNIFSSTLILFIFNVIFAIINYPEINFFFIVSNISISIFIFYRCKDKALYQVRDLLKSSFYIVN